MTLLMAGPLGSSVTALSVSLGARAPSAPQQAPEGTRKGAGAAAAVRPVARASRCAVGGVAAIGRSTVSSVRLPSVTSSASGAEAMAGSPPSLSSLGGRGNTAPPVCAAEPGPAEAPARGDARGTADGGSPSRLRAVLRSVGSTARSLCLEVAAGGPGQQAGGLTSLGWAESLTARSSGLPPPPGSAVARPNAGSNAGEGATRDAPASPGKASGAISSGGPNSAHPTSGSKHSASTVCVCRVPSRLVGN